VSVSHCPYRLVSPRAKLLTNLIVPQLIKKRLVSHVGPLLGNGPTEGNSCTATEEWSVPKCIYRRSQDSISHWSQSVSGVVTRLHFSVWQLRVSWCGAPSLTRGRVCNLLVQLLLGLARAVTLGLKSRRIRNHILLPHLRLPQPGRPGPSIYISQEQDGPVIPPDTLVSRIIASYYSQGYGGGIRSRLHTGTSKSKLYYDRRSSRPVCFGVRHPSETRAFALITSRHEPHRKHRSLILRHTENAVPRLRRAVISWKWPLLIKILLSNGWCVVPCLALGNRKFSSKWTFVSNGSTTPRRQETHEIYSEMQ
jgi:hypothetical protein